MRAKRGRQLRRPVTCGPISTEEAKNVSNDSLGNTSPIAEREFDKSSVLPVWTVFVTSQPIPLHSHPQEYLALPRVLRPFRKAATVVSVHLVEIGEKARPLCRADRKNARTKPALLS
jgi:hypothetical protein